VQVDGGPEGDGGGGGRRPKTPPVVFGACGRRGRRPAAAPRRGQDPVNPNGDGAQPSSASPAGYEPFHNGIDGSLPVNQKCVGSVGLEPVLAGAIVPRDVSWCPDAQEEWEVVMDNAWLRHGHGILILLASMASVETGHLGGLDRDPAGGGRRQRLRTAHHPVDLTFWRASPASSSRSWPGPRWIPT